MKREVLFTMPLLSILLFSFLSRLEMTFHMHSGAEWPGFDPDIGIVRLCLYQHFT